MSSGFLATGITLAFKYFPSLATAEWIDWFKEYQLEVIFVAGILGGLLYGPYAIYCELQKAAAKRGKDYADQERRLLKEAQEARQALLELRTKFLAADEEKIDDVANQYRSLFTGKHSPDNPVERIKLLLEAGLMSLKDTPDALALVEKKVRDRGVSNPFGGSEEDNDGPDYLEAPYWGFERLWPFLERCQAHSVFIGGDWFSRYLDSFQNEPYIPPPIVKGNHVFTRILEEGRWDQEPSEPSPTEVENPSSAEQPETPAATPHQA